MSAAKNLLKRYARMKGWADSRAGRTDLSFVTEDPRGGIDRHWDVAHDPDGLWHEGVERGRARFHEVVELARKNPPEAFLAIVHAQAQMQPGGWGEEQGFMMELGRYAVAAALHFEEGIPVFLDAEQHSDAWHSDWVERKCGIRRLEGASHE